MLALAPLAGRAPFGEDIVRHDKRLGIPAQLRSCSGNLITAKRRAVCCRSALLVWRTLTDDRLAGDQAWARIGHRILDRAGNIGMVMPIATDCVPAGRTVPRKNILAGREISAAVDGDVVVIPQHIELAELEVTGKTDGFVIDAFHQTTVASDHPGAVVDQIVTEMRVELAFCNRHTHCHCNALPQRAGGAFDPVEQEVLRVASTGAAKLPEIADVIHRRRGITTEVEQRVNQHRAMARAQHETIAIMPFGRRRVEFEIFRPKDGRNIGHPHRHAGVP